MSQRQIIVSFIVISAATMCKFVSIYHLKNEESTIYESSYTTETVFYDSCPFCNEVLHSIPIL